MEANQKCQSNNYFTHDGEKKKKQNAMLQERNVMKIINLENS